MPINKHTCNNESKEEREIGWKFHQNGNKGITNNTCSILIEIELTLEDPPNNKTSLQLHLNML